MATIRIDRSDPFNPKPLFGDRWGIHEHHDANDPVVLLDTSLIRLDYRPGTAGSGEFVTNEDRLRLLKAGTGIIRLDGRTMQTLIEQPSAIPEEWRTPKLNGDVPCIFFHGTVLRSLQDNRRYFPYLYWNADIAAWTASFLGNRWGIRDPSAIL